MASVYRALAFDQSLRGQRRQRGVEFRVPGEIAQLARAHRALRDGVDHAARRRAERNHFERIGFARELEVAARFDPHRGRDHHPVGLG